MIQQPDSKQNASEILFHTNASTYKGDYYADCISIYKMYVEMADRISQRRQSANTYYLSVNTALLAIPAIFSSHLPNEYQFLLVCAAGISLSSMWIRNIQSYSDLNSGKFRIINLIESRLPLSPYEAEWEILKRGTDFSIYRPFKTVESAVPWIFIFLYIIIGASIFDWVKIGLFFKGVFF